MSSSCFNAVNSWTVNIVIMHWLARLIGFRECHIQPDWLLVYLIEDDVLTLTLVDTGTHADIFDL